MSLASPGLDAFPSYQVKSPWSAEFNTELFVFAKTHKQSIG